MEKKYITGQQFDLTILAFGQELRDVSAPFDKQIQIIDTQVRSIKDSISELDAKRRQLLEQRYSCLLARKVAKAEVLQRRADFIANNAVAPGVRRIAENNITLPQMYNLQRMIKECLVRAAEEKGLDTGNVSVSFSAREDGNYSFEIHL